MRHTIWPYILERTLVYITFMITTYQTDVEAGPRYSSRIVNTRSGDIRGIILELNSRHLEPVEVFRGIPYAEPPVNELRFEPPQPIVRWSGTKLADTFPPVCPQKYPDISNRTAALQFMPKGRYHYLKKLVPHLTNQSEDCLYLNLYIPGSGNRGLEAPYAVMVYIHGESFEWGSGNPYDGSVLASYGHVIMVTVNYRLGILGFLKTSKNENGQRNVTNNMSTSSSHPSRASFPSSSKSGSPGRTSNGGGNLALYDISTALKWIRDNIRVFGGDPARVTLIGHDTGAALVNLLLISTIAKGLFTRVILLSGSALSPWATIQNAETLRTTVGKQFGCISPPSPQINSSIKIDTSENVLDDIAPCLRNIPLPILLEAQLEQTRFMPRIAPFLPIDPVTLDPNYSMEHSSEMFITCELMLGVTTTESYSDFTANDIQYGFEEDQRNRVLRTYIRNAYVYHLNEIFSAVRNEYTDWDKPIQHPINIRDSTMEALSDGHTVSPLIRVAYLHARRGAKTYFFHFGYQTKDSDYPQRLGSIRGEDITYFLGLPLVNGLPYFPQNFSRADMGVAEATLNFFTNFAKTGDPNEPRENKNDYGTIKEKTRYQNLNWETYEVATQQYLSLTSKPRMKSHYRGHKMAVWLNLIPQLHQPGDDDVSMRHHHFHEREQHYYAGSVKPESFTRLPPPLHPAALGDPQQRSAASTASGGNTECITQTTTVLDNRDEPLILDDVLSNVSEDDPLPDEDVNILERLANRHYYSYTAALGVTVGVGCLLLLLNMLIFAGIYYQRGRDRRKHRHQNSPSCENIPLSQRPVVLNNQAQQPPSPTTPICAHVIKLHEPPPCYATVNKTQTGISSEITTLSRKSKKNIQKPHPPMRTSSVPSHHCRNAEGTSFEQREEASPPKTGNLKNSCSETGTNTIKKRVQIQEISV